MPNMLSIMEGVKLPDDDDPFYGHPAFPYAMVLINNHTGEKLYAVIMHFDGNDHVRLWLCLKKKFIIVKTSDYVHGAAIHPMIDDSRFFCTDCGKANDLWQSKTVCGSCVSGRN